MMREHEVEAKIRSYLLECGYESRSRATQSGPDIVATKEGKKLLVEVKGDRPGHRSSPGTINVDVMTLLGQIIFRAGEEQADEYAIAIRPVHERLIRRALPALRKLSGCAPARVSLMVGP